jgi:hypothetical protein
MRDEHTKHDKQWRPQVLRVEIPLRSVVNLRRVASELRGLASRLDALSRDPSDASDVLADADRAVRHTQANMRKIRSPGRPAKRTESLRWIR